MARSNPSHSQLIPPSNSGISNLIRLLLHPSYSPTNFLTKMLLRFSQMLVVVAVPLYLLISLPIQRVQGHNPNAVANPYVNADGIVPIVMAVDPADAANGNGSAIIENDDAAAQNNSAIPAQASADAVPSNSSAESVPSDAAADAVGNTRTNPIEAAAAMDSNNTNGNGTNSTASNEVQMDLSKNATNTSSAEAADFQAIVDGSKNSGLNGSREQLDSVVNGSREMLDSVNGSREQLDSSGSGGGSSSAAPASSSTSPPPASSSSSSSPPPATTMATTAAAAARAIADGPLMEVAALPAAASAVGAQPAAVNSNNAPPAPMALANVGSSGCNNVGTTTEPPSSPSPLNLAVQMPMMEAQQTCTSADCNGHGTCIGIRGLPICLCSAGYTGSRCQESACNASDNCNGRGWCMGTNRQFTCFCQMGYSGNQCQNQQNSGR